MRTRLLAFALAAAVWGGPANALDPSYSPFVGKQPVPFPMISLQKDKSLRRGWDTRFTSGDAQPTINVESVTIDASAHCRTRIDISVGGQVVATIASPVAALEQVYSADFLRNGTRGLFIIGANQGACGLAAHICLCWLVVPAGSKYKIYSWTAFDANEHDVVFDEKRERPVFVICELRGGIVGTDRKTHNYWIYQPYTLGASGLEPCFRLGASFPRIIAYTFDPNHSDTRQLSSRQRLLWDVASDAPAVTGRIVNARQQDTESGVIFDCVVDPGHGPTYNVVIKPGEYGSWMDERIEPAWFRGFTPEDERAFIRPGRVAQVWGKRAAQRVDAHAIRLLR